MTAKPFASFNKTPSGKIRWVRIDGKSDEHQAPIYIAAKSPTTVRLPLNKQPIEDIHWGLLDGTLFESEELGSYPSKVKKRRKPSSAPGKLKLLPDSNPAEEHFVLHYNPMRADTGLRFSGEQHFRTFVAVIVLFSILVSAAGCYLSEGRWQFVWLLVPLLTLPLVLLDVCRPTNMEISPKGIRFHWIYPFFFFSGYWLGWEAVVLAKYIDGKVRGIPKIGKCFDMTIDVSKLKWFPKLSLETLCTTITSSCDKEKLTIRFLEPGFFQESDQSILRRMLCKCMFPDRLDSRLLAREEFGEVPAFTALWLDRLNRDANAERSCIPDGAELASGKYRIQSRMGSGGQAVVYDAVQLSDLPEQDARPCVVKEFVLPMRGGIEIKGRAIDHIRQEAHLLKSLDHPKVVKYMDLFTEGSRAYLVMERVDGTSLSNIVERKGPMSSEQVLSLANEMCEILQYLHSQNPPVVHRDFTPENLMLCNDGHIKLIDFNVAQRFESNSTRTVVGKHAYVPPEQFRGFPTPQSDIYAFGATLYFLLTGEEPEPITKADPRTLCQTVHPKLAKIVAQSTEPSAENRYQNVAEIISELSTIAAN
jgi:hypothetical protein